MDHQGPYVDSTVLYVSSSLKAGDRDLLVVLREELSKRPCSIVVYFSDEEHFNVATVAGLRDCQRAAAERHVDFLVGGLTSKGKAVLHICKALHLLRVYHEQSLQYPTRQMTLMLRVRRILSALKSVRPVFQRFSLASSTAASVTDRLGYDQPKTNMSKTLKIAESFLDKSALSK